MKRKLERRIVLWFDERSFFNVIKGCKLYCDYKPNRIFSVIKWSIFTFDKVNLRCDCFEGNFVNGISQTSTFNFALQKPPGLKSRCEPQTIQYRKLNKINLNETMIRKSENVKDDLSGENMTFALILTRRLATTGIFCALQFS